MKALWTAVFLTASILLAHAHPDEVTSLPGLPSQPDFRHYSGYLNTTNGSYLHYWFVESSGDPMKDPLVLWLNGGPGCSSLAGFFAEHGPFRVHPGGRELYFNPYRWNLISNIIYLESPTCVGFSHSQDSYCVADDDTASLGNYIALQSFFQKFPQFANHDFYIAGESYAGIYVPTLAVRIVTGTFPINFKGFAVGNGRANCKLEVNSLYFFYRYHGFLGKDFWDRLTKQCCSGRTTLEECDFLTNSKDWDCWSLVFDADKTVGESGYNRYNIHADCDLSHEWMARSEYESKHFFKFYDYNVCSGRRTARLDGIPCISTTDMTVYLNQRTVREALHIPSEVQDWTVCNGIHKYYRTIYNDLTDHYRFLLPKVRGLIYNGDGDTTVNYLGNEWFCETLGRKVLRNYTYWKVGSQLAGFVKQYDNLDFVVIKGAGHMVPADKPKEAFAMFKAFLFQEPY